MATTTAPPGEGLTIHAAAAALGMSPSTVRRRIKEGRLHAMQRPTTQGYEWRVFLGDHLPTTGAHLPTSGDQVVTTNGADDDYVLTRGEQVATTGEYLPTNPPPHFEGAPGRARRAALPALGRPSRSRRATA